MTQRSRSGGDNQSPDAAPACYFDWLHEDRRAIAAAIREQTAAELPLLAGLSGDVRTVLYQGVDTALAAFIDNGIGHDMLDRPGLTAMKAVGEAAADADVPLDALAGCINVAARVVRDWPTHRRAVEPGEREAFRAFSEHTTTFANAVSSIVLDAFTSRAAQRLAHRRRREFWHAVLAGTLDQEEDVTREAAAAGCGLASPWALVVALPGRRCDLEPAITAEFPGAVAFEPQAGNSPPPTAVALPAGADPLRLRARLCAIAEKAGAVLAVVGPSDQPLELGARYRNLLPLFDRLDALTAGPTVVAADELGAAAVLATVPGTTAAAFTIGLLAGVDRQPSTRARKWLATIDALVHNGASPKSAARALEVSEKTIRRRMAAIQKEAGLLFDSFDALFQLRIAMTLRRLSTSADNSDSEKCPDENPMQPSRLPLRS